jgi:hypothetical protein
MGFADWNSVRKHRETDDLASRAALYIHPDVAGLPPVNAIRNQLDRFWVF